MSVNNYVNHFDPDRSHHKAWLEAVLSRLLELDPKALDDGGELRTLWKAAVETKAPALKVQQPVKEATALAPLLAIIRAGEGPDYHAVNKGRANDTPKGWPELVELTVSQVKDAQQKQLVFAVGAYQFIPETLKMAQKAAGVKDDALFNFATQDALAVALLLGGKRPKLAAYLKGGAIPQAEAQLELAKEWASIPMATGRGFYDGDKAGNKATAKVAAVQAALEFARAGLSGKPVTVKPAAAAVPQSYSQRDNGAQSERSCFSASGAMLLKRVKPGALTGANADLEYLKVVNRFGDTTDANAQIKALKTYGVTARLIKTASWDLIDQQVKRWGGCALGWIHRGPVTAPDPKCDGHWIFCYGIDATHITVHDPYGEGDMVNGGFVPGKSGRSVRYSRKNFGRRWMVSESPRWTYAPGNGWALVVDSIT